LNCPGYYDLNGCERVNIGYVIDVLTNEMNINLSSNPEIEFGGKYEIESFSRKRLSITGGFSIEDEEVRTSYDINMELKKKQRRIRLP
jgi:hypothetical protein